MRALLPCSILVALFALWTIVEPATAAACGGCQSGSDDWESRCSGRSLKTRQEKYRACKRKWWRTRCTDAYRVQIYYTSSPVCCTNYLQKEGRCVKNGCGGCSGTLASQRACSDRAMVTNRASYVSTYKCGGWLRRRRCTRTSYRVRSSTQTQYRCCFGYTLYGTTCRQSKSSTPTGQCGISKYSNPGSTSGSWIVGGTQARPNEFPWQVSLRRLGSNSHFCGGTIISPTRILTAAHCVRAVSSFRVYVGDHRRSVTESTQRIHSVASFVVHGSFSSTTLANDVAIVRLATPIIFNTNVRSACLPTSSSKSYVNRNVVISGWGRTSTNGPASDALLYAWVKVATAAFCKQHYSSAYIGSSVLCVTDNTGDDDKSSCFGDSGGPMVVKEADGKWYLVGVTSFVAGKPVGCAGGKPFGYQNVAYHLNWIKARI